MEPPDTQVTSSVLALLEYYQWMKFTIIYQDNGRWDTIAEHLKVQVNIMIYFITITTTSQGAKKS